MYANITMHYAMIGNLRKGGESSMVKIVVLNLDSQREQWLFLVEMEDMSIYLDSHY